MSNDKQFKRPDGSEAKSIRFIRPSELATNGTTGVIVEGTFVGTLPSPVKEGASDFKFEADNGEILVLNTAGNLGYRMKDVAAGDYCRVIYEGKKELKSGKFKGKPVHSFDVLIAD